MNDTTAAKVVRIVSEILGVAEHEIEMESRFVEDLDAESIQSVELMAAFEEEFGIEMDEEEAMQVKTVGQAVEYIEKCLEDQR